MEGDSKTSVLVLGGSYFLGRVFVETLAARPGFSPAVVNRGNRPLNLPGVEEVRCDRRDTARLSGLLKERSFDVTADFCAYERADVEALFAAVPVERLGHYLHVSTASVYAETRDLPVGEEAKKQTSPLPGPHGDYPSNKYLAEFAATAAFMRKKASATIFRPTIIYGRYNYAPRESWFFEAVQSGSPLPLPENDLPLFTFVYVEDVVEAMIRAMGNGKAAGRAFNLAGPELVSYGRYVEVLEQVMGQKIPVRRLSVREIERQGISLPYPLDSHLAYSGEAAREALSFSYTPFVSGMARTWAWYQGARKEAGHE